MSLTPVAFYGLEVQAGDMPVPALDDFQSIIRITMAALDPDASPQEDTTNGKHAPRASLKVIRVPLDDMSDSDEDSEEDGSEDDIDAIEKRIKAGGAMGSEDEDEESSDDDEDKHGGPSDPSKSKKAKKAAAVKKLLDGIKNGDDMDVDEATNGVNGTKGSKGKAAKMEEESDEDDDDFEEEAEEFVVCTLDPRKHYQERLDITIPAGDQVYFRVTGTHNIYLTGNYVVPEGGPEDYDSEDEDMSYDMSPDEDELDGYSDEESDDLDNLPNPRITEVESDEEPPKLVKAEAKKGKNKRSAEDDAGASLDDLIKKSEANGEQLTKAQRKKLKNNAGQAVAGSEEKAKDSKSSKETPPSAKSDKKVQFAKNLEQGPTGSPLPKPDNKKDPKEAKKDDAKSKPALGVKNVEGVTVDDKKLGKGPAAKNGSKVSLRYIGKLDNGKVFDSNKKGKPFSFTCGKGEVIKGMDLGLAGMQAGGERRITIPAKLGYGSRDAPPDIPGNSNLTFDLKLLTMS